MDCKKADKSILHSFTSLVGFVICALQVYSFFYKKSLPVETHCLIYVNVCHDEYLVCVSYWNSMYYIVQ